MNVKGILLDLDDTLYEYDVTHNIALNTALIEVANKYQIAPNRILSAFEFAKKKIKSILPNVAANHSRILYFQIMFEKLNLNPIPDAYAISNLYWNTFIDNIALTKDAIFFLEKYKHLPICLITDLTSEIQYRKIERLSLTKSIDYIVTSEEAGVEKPHPFIFKCAMSKLNLSINEVVMIGDNYNKDITGASLLGIKSFWISRNSNEENILFDGCIRVNSLYDVVLK